MKSEKKIHFAIAIFLFVVTTLAFFKPILSGKQMRQGDIMQFKGMAKEVIDFREDNDNKEPYWLGNAFSGMPAYQVTAFYPNDFIRYIDKAFRFLPRPADYLFLYFFSFFFLLNALKVNWRLAVVGALSFGFSTYLIIIFGAGHNAKAHAIGYIPLVVSGFIYVFRKQYWLGFIITALAMALEVFSNHPQMTYYLGFCLLILVIIEGLEAQKKNDTSTFLKQIGVLAIACIIGIGANASRLLAMKEYADYSNRGKSELTINPDGSPKEKELGLDKDYITQYSYGKLETFNLLVPRFMGGGTVEKLGKNSNFYQAIAQAGSKKAAEEYSKQVFTYWGDQPIVEAPAYIGAVLIFLFILGIFLVKGKYKKWLVSATIFSILLSWGKNLPVITDLLIDYLPLYNKFRAVSSIQVIAEFCVPLLGVLALKEIFNSTKTITEKTDGLKKALYVSGGLVILGYILANVFATFEGLQDVQYKDYPTLLQAIFEDRKAMLSEDSLRSIILISLAGLLIWLFLKKKIQKNLLITLFGILILFDLVSVNIKYVNSDDFTHAKKINKPFTANQADKEILEDTTYYRVANLTGNFLNEARTSYFHKSVGGYHAAKMKRYQEIFEYQYEDDKQRAELFNMLNTKYIIVGSDQVQVNPFANGNVWFVDAIKIADSADQEMMLFSSILDTKKAAVVRNRSDEELNLKIEKDAKATIHLKKYGVNELQYESNASKNQFAVFSEIYYKDGWNAYIDGKLTPHYQTNYILRGMLIPKGKHEIIFKFEPKVIKQGATIALVSYALLLLIPIGWFFYDNKKS